MAEQTEKLILENLRRLREEVERVGSELRELRRETREELSDGHRLVIAMLNGLYKHHNLGQPNSCFGEDDMDFIMRAINDEQIWALRWKYRGLLYNSENKSRIVEEVCDILRMWDAIERTCEDFSDEKECTFPGFDANEKGGHYFVAEFMIEKLELFERFQGRRLNCHCPVIEGYRRMLEVFKPISLTIGRDGMSAEQVEKILCARFPEETQQ
jgi:uncharacterized protein YfbU (UPF0304 family)